MILIPKGLARSFRTAVRKCGAARSKGPSPLVIVRSESNSLQLAAMIGGVALALKVPQEEASFQTLIVPGVVLDTVEGAAVELMAENFQGTARWKSPRHPSLLTLLPSGPESRMNFRNAQNRSHRYRTCSCQHSTSAAGSRSSNQPDSP